jgi:hypothetical protein
MAVGASQLLAAPFGWRFRNVICGRKVRVTARMSSCMTGRIPEAHRANPGHERPLATCYLPPESGQP